MNKPIKLSAVHYEMLVDVSKRRRLKPEQILEEIIQLEFNSKK
tara:strand:+ start:5579 stop:5707 length:129 start_codon:yes stop_codon:yes gene_type:complete